MSSPCRSRFALDFVHGCLLNGPTAPRTLEQFLRELAAAFAARGAALGELWGCTPRVLQQDWVEGAPVAPNLPWTDQPELIARLETENRATPVRVTAGRSWLVAVLPDQRLLWLADDRSRYWTEAEAAALTLCGLVVLQLDPGSAGAFPALDAAALLAGRLAHAFGNVLTGVLGFAEVAAQQVAPGSPVQQNLNEVLQAAYHGVDLIQQLHQFQCAGKKQPGATQLPGLLEDLRHSWQARLGPGVSLELAVAHELPRVRLAAEALHQALGELIRNAAEALGPPGRVVISAQSQPGWAGPGVAVQVADTGPGLSEQVQRHLAREAFFSTKPRHRGLGLAVVRQMMWAHGGSFFLGNGPQGGAVAGLWLPAADPTSEQGDFPCESIQP